MRWGFKPRDFDVPEKPTAKMEDGAVFWLRRNDELEEDMEEELVPAGMTERAYIEQLVEENMRLKEQVRMLSSEPLHMVLSGTSNPRDVAQGRAAWLRDAETRMRNELFVRTAGQANDIQQAVLPALPIRQGPHYFGGSAIDSSAKSEDLVPWTMATSTSGTSMEMHNRPDF